MEVDVMKKIPVREQDSQVRATNFEEVCLGYNKEIRGLLSLRNSSLAEIR